VVLNPWPIRKNCGWLVVAERRRWIRLRLFPAFWARYNVTFFSEGGFDSWTLCTPIVITPPIVGIAGQTNTVSDPPFHIRNTTTPLLLTWSTTKWGCDTALVWFRIFDFHFFATRFCTIIVTAVLSWNRWIAPGSWPGDPLFIVLGARSDSVVLRFIVNVPTSTGKKIL
jgi:hypothetical protein